MAKKQPKPDLAVVVPLPSGRLVEVPTVIDQVYDEWLRVTGRNPKKHKPTKERAAAIKARLNEGYELDELLDAVRGIMRSDWHVDHDETELATILSNGGKVEKFRDLWHSPPRASADRKQSGESKAEAAARGVDRVFRGRTGA